MSIWQEVESSRVAERTGVCGLVEPVCRAYYKIQEIIEYYFSLWGWKDFSLIDGVVVDIGASPGGWTQYLASISKKVIAIDPGDLHPTVSRLENVCHVQALVESSEAQEAMRAAQIEGVSGEHSGVLACVCDINVEVIFTAKILAKWVLPFISTNAGIPFVVMTLKMNKSPKQKHIDFARDQAVQILSPFCHDFKLVHLNANSSNERTLICRTKSIF